MVVAAPEERNWVLVAQAAAEDVAATLEEQDQV